MELSTGCLGSVVQDGVNGTRTTVLAAFNSLATILFDCSGGGSCGAFFAAATPPGEPPPDTTLRALLKLALNPWNDVGARFDLVPVDDPVFVPTLLYPPTGWTLSLVYTGGGLFGAAFGMAIDQDGHAWVGNFAGDGPSEFTPEGAPLSPDALPAFSDTGGYQDPPVLSMPQSVVVNQEHNIWVTNLGNNTVTQLVRGDPALSRTAPGPGCPNGFDRPWGMAVARDGDIWITNFASDSVSRLDPRSDPLCPDPQIPVRDFPPPATPQGFAVDSHGNLRISDTDAGRVSLLRSPDFTPPKSFTGEGSISGPFGIAVDGADNIWVPNFFGQSLVNLCGVPTEILSTQCGGDGVVVFFGLAAPMAAPLIGPPRQP